MKRVGIIGGGVAGVSAAYELSRWTENRGAAEVVLFEATSRLGGIVETVHEQGFTIECGPDGWLAEKPWCGELAVELGLGDEIIGSNDHLRKTHVLVEGRLRAIPDGMRMMVPGDLEAIESSDLFSEASQKAYREEVHRAAELRSCSPVGDESVASFVRRHFGAEVLEKIGAPLLSGIFGGDVEALSVRAVMPAFVAMEREFGSLVVALRERSRSAKEPGASLFATLQSGLGTLIDRMAAVIPPECIRYGDLVASIARDGDRWIVSSTTGEQSFDRLLVAAPLHAARSLIAPLDRRAAELMTMEASSSIIVAFGFKGASALAIPEGFGFLVPAGSGKALLACTFVDQKFEARVPPGGRLLRAFLGGEAAERLTDASDVELAKIARRELGSVLGALPEPDVTVVRRWPRSLPQYAVGHLERMAELQSRISHHIPGLALLGNGYRGVGLPDVIRDARAAARQSLETA